MLNFSSSTWFLALQWAYTLWQAVRNTRGFCLCYYTLQWLLLHCFDPSARNKKIVWVNDTHKSDYFKSSDCPDDKRIKMRHCLDPTEEELKLEHALEIQLLGKELSPNVYRNGIEFLLKDHAWYQVKYKGKYYWVHQNVFAEVCCHEFENCQFVTDLYDLQKKYSVARRISAEKAMLMMFNKDMHLYEIRNRTVLHGKEFNIEFNIEFNSKLGGFLSTIPLILQAKQFNAASAIASLVLLMVDLCRTPVYKIYDRGFFQVSKAVKLGVFRRRTWLYTAFGLFSDRWKYSDFVKGYAYITAPGDEIEVTSYVSAINADDCRYWAVHDYDKVNPDMQHFTIRDGVIASSGFSYGQYTALFKVKEGMYVS